MVVKTKADTETGDRQDDGADHADRPRRIVLRSRHSAEADSATDPAAEEAGAAKTPQPAGTDRPWALKPMFTRPRPTSGPRSKVQAPGTGKASADEAETGSTRRRIPPLTSWTRRENRDVATNGTHVVDAGAARRRNSEPPLSLVCPVPNDDPPLRAPNGAAPRRISQEAADTATAAPEGSDVGSETPLTSGADDAESEGDATAPQESAPAVDGGASAATGTDSAEKEGTAPATRTEAPAAENAAAESVLADSKTAAEVITPDRNEEANSDSGVDTGSEVAGTQIDPDPEDTVSAQTAGDEGIGVGDPAPSRPVEGTENTEAPEMSQTESVETAPPAAENEPASGLLEAAPTTDAPEETGGAEAPVAGDALDSDAAKAGDFQTADQESVGPGGLADGDAAKAESEPATETESAHDADAAESATDVEHGAEALTADSQAADTPAAEPTAVAGTPDSENAPATDPDGSTESPVDTAPSDAAAAAPEEPDAPPAESSQQEPDAQSGIFAAQEDSPGAEGDGPVAESPEAEETAASVEEQPSGAPHGPVAAAVTTEADSDDDPVVFAEPLRADEAETASQETSAASPDLPAETAEQDHRAAATAPDEDAAMEARVLAEVAKELERRAQEAAEAMENASEPAVPVAEDPPAEKAAPEARQDETDTPLPADKAALRGLIREILRQEIETTMATEIDRRVQSVVAERLFHAFAPRPGA